MEDATQEAVGSSGEPDDGPSPNRASSKTRALTGLGWLVADASLVAVLAIVALAVDWIISGGSEALVIAISTVPLVLALAAFVWPSPRLRRQREPVTLVDAPTVDLAAHDNALGELLEVARQQARVEEDRIASISARAGWLLGFAGVILALVGGQAENVFKDAPSLGSVGRPLASWLLVGAAAMTAISAAAALQALLPKPSARITPEGLARFLEPSSYDTSRANIRYAQLRLLIEQVEDDRLGNDRRWDWLSAAFATLLVGLVFLLLHVGVFLERSVEKRCPLANSAAVEVAAHRSEHFALPGWRRDALSSLTASQASPLGWTRHPPSVEATPAAVDALEVAGGSSRVTPASGATGSRGPPCFPTEKPKK
jgi:hypothetical protein